MLDLEIVLLSAAIVIAVGLVSFFIVQHDEVVIFKRLGSFAEVCKSGFYLRLPVLYTTQWIDWKFHYDVVEGSLKVLSSDRIPLRELRYNPTPLECVTKDNICLKVDLVVKFLITNPKDAGLLATNLFADIEDAVLTKLYAVIRTLLMTEVDPERVTTELEKSNINQSLTPLGTKIMQARVRSINLPGSIRDAERKAS